MTSPDPHTCRRALREIGEIAAVAVLDDSQMTDHEALQTIAAIAEWVSETAPAERAGCGDAICRLNAITAGVDFDGLEDREAVALFAEMLETLKTSNAGGSAERVEAYLP
jgi:hypothetical protein